MKKRYKIGDVYWYVAYGRNEELRVYSIKVCSAHDMDKGEAQFDSKEEAELYILADKGMKGEI